MIVALLCGFALAAGVGGLIFFIRRRGVKRSEKYQTQMDDDDVVEGEVMGEGAVIAISTNGVVEDQNDVEL